MFLIEYELACSFSLAPFFPLSSVSVAMVVFFYYVLVDLVSNYFISHNLSIYLVGIPTFQVTNQKTVCLFLFFSYFLQVVFRLIMFRPFEGEIIAAKLKESNSTGLRCMSCTFLLI